MRFSLVSNYQPTKVVRPGEGPFDYPPMAVVGHLSFPAWSRPFSTSFRDARLDSPPPQPVSECSRIVASVGYQFPGTTAGSSPGPRYPHRCQGSLGQSDLRPLGAGHQGSQRGSLVVYHQHQFGALALAGQSYLVSPFLAGAKVASRWPVPIPAYLGHPECPAESARYLPRPLLVQSSPASHGTAVLSRKIPPAAARAQHIQDTIDGAPVIGSGTPPPLRRWQPRLYQFPLGIAQFLLHRSTPHIPFGQEHKPYPVFLKWLLVLQRRFR